MLRAACRIVPRGSSATRMGKGSVVAARRIRGALGGPSGLGPRARLGSGLDMAMKIDLKMLRRVGEAIDVQLSVSDERLWTTVQEWNPARFAHQDRMLLEWVLGEGWAVAYGDGEGFKHQVWHMKSVGIPVEFDCPAAEVLTRAVDHIWRLKR